MFQGNRLTIVDTATGAKRDITAPTAITELEVSGPIAFWVDPANAVWKLDLAGGVPARVEVARARRRSSHRRPMAGGSRSLARQHLLLVDRTSSTLPPEVITDGQVNRHDLVRELAPPGRAHRRRDRRLMLAADAAHRTAVSPVGQRFSIAYSAGRIFSAGPDRRRDHADNDGNRMRAPRARAHARCPRRPRQGRDLGQAAGRDRRAVGSRRSHAYAPDAARAGRDVGTRPVDRRRNRRPAARMEPRRDRAAAVATAHAEQRALRHRRSPDRDVRRPARRVDRSAHRTPRCRSACSLAIETVAAHPTATEAIVIDHATSRVARRRHRSTAGARRRGQRGDRSSTIMRLVLAGAGGLRLEDQQQPHQARCSTRTRPPRRRLAATADDGGWIVAAFEDGHVWRKHLSTNRRQPRSSSAPVPGRAAARRSPTTARRCSASAASSARGARDGTRRRDRQADQACSASALVDRNTVRRARRDGSATLVDLDHAATLAATDARARYAGRARRRAVVCSSATDRDRRRRGRRSGRRLALAARDPAAKARPRFRFVDIAPDGSRVLATNATEVFVWTLDLPDDVETDEGVARQAITNATSDNPAGGPSAGSSDSAKTSRSDSLSPLRFAARPEGAVRAARARQGRRCTSAARRPTRRRTSATRTRRSAFDTIRRSLEFLGYEVTLRPQRHRRRRQDHQARATSAARIRSRSSARFTDDYNRDMARFNVRRPTSSPRSPTHIPEIIAIIERLIANGKAYAVDGDVYFAVDDVPAVRQAVAGRRSTSSSAGARVERRRAQARTRRLRAVEGAPSRASRRGTRRGARAGPAGTSSARR